MKNIEEESLIDVLSYCSVRELPKEDDKQNVWIKAIGKVAKIDGTTSYVSLVKGLQGEDKITRDFGTSSSIKKMLKVYPYLYLDSSYLPNFKTQKKEERINFLTRSGVTEDLSNKSLKELDKMVINVASRNQLARNK